MTVTERHSYTQRTGPGGANIRLDDFRQIEDNALSLRSKYSAFTARQSMITAPAIADCIASLGISHIVWLPDSTIGPWERALSESPQLRLLRVCREGEIWPLAAGLFLGGKSPLAIMQSTGFFESGDALRNVLFDLGLPLFALVGYRSYLLEDSPDTARKFVEPILSAWGLDHTLIRDGDDLPQLADFYRACRQSSRPGVALIAEGKM